ncbi:MAG TPA: 2-C-methyl-D-erythritol 2,4-cyclodiphosphate synthase [Candidatus Kapabacteria bacterium]|nr:2-C-methyl-D-erythritol 2,4-cyclodiphosphate synthase [Candidatus Kapabacteria bacterium]
MVGFGFDVHRLASGESLILAGVNFENAELGTVAHSDGDVLLHAIMDALLGSLALGDIGEHFPDTDERYRGASSMELLKHVRDLVLAKNVKIVNIDSMVVLEAPRLRPHVETMRRNIASALEIPFERVSIKATTNEKLGFIGRREGVTAYAVCEAKEL